MSWRRSTQVITSSVREKPDASIILDASATASLAKKRLLRIQEVASWQRNPYILSGFRPESKSYTACLRSLGYIHNQTGNIYSHGLAVPLMWSIGLVLYNYAEKEYPSAGSHDWIVFSMFLLGMTIGYSLSTAFHLFCNHSEIAHGNWLRLDLLGIIVIIAGGFPPGLYYTFYCMHEATKFYWMTVALCAQGVGVFFVLFVPQFSTPQWSTVRSLFYVLLGSFGFIPVLAKIYLHGLEQARTEAAADYYMTTAAFYALGAVLYALKWPESQWPGKFDLWGHSHQLFHVCIVVGLLFHSGAFVSSFHYHHTVGTC